MIFPTTKNSMHNLIISNEVKGEKIVPGKQLCLTSPINLQKKLRMTSSPTGRGMMIQVLHSVPKREMRERNPRGKQES